MTETQKRLKQIKIENFIWFIYLILISLSILANEYEKKYFCFHDLIAKEKYRKLTIGIFSVAIIIYFYFFFDSYQDIKTNNYYKSMKNKNLSNLSLLGSTLILISGIIFLYIAIVDKDLEIELAFN